MKNIMNRVPEKFEELLASISSMVSFCNYAKIVEKQQSTCRIVFNVKGFGSSEYKNQVKGVSIRNDVSENRDTVIIFLEDCIGYPQVLELTIKQTFYLFLSLLGG